MWREGSSPHLLHRKGTREGTWLCFIYRSGIQAGKRMWRIMSSDIITKTSLIESQRYLLKWPCKTRMTWFQRWALTVVQTSLVTPPPSNCISCHQTGFRWSQKLCLVTVGPCSLRDCWSRFCCPLARLHFCCLFLCYSSKRWAPDYMANWANKLQSAAVNGYSGHMLPTGGQFLCIAPLTKVNPWIEHLSAQTSIRFR